MTTGLRTGRPHAARSPHVRHAWWCVAAAPVALVVAFVAAEAMSALLGYTGEGVPPWWVGGTAVLAAVVVLAVPTALAWWFAREAAREGDPRGRLPSTLMLALGGCFVAVNLFSWGMRVLLE